MYRYGGGQDHPPYRYRIFYYGLTALKNCREREFFFAVRSDLADWGKIMVRSPSQSKVCIKITFRPSRAPFLVPSSLQLRKKSRVSRRYGLSGKSEGNPRSSVHIYMLTGNFENVLAAPTARGGQGRSGGVRGGQVGAKTPTRKGIVFSAPRLPFSPPVWCAVFGVQSWLQLADSSTALSLLLQSTYSLTSTQLHPCVQYRARVLPATSSRRPTNTSEDTASWTTRPSENSIRSVHCQDFS